MKLLEKHLEAQVRDYLEKVEGWRCFHFESIWSEERRRQFGELGMPDLLCLRYGRGVCGSNDVVLWIELKQPGGKARANQKLWHIRERKCGALTLIAGEDFEPTYEGFIEFYKKSGLRRRA